MIGQLFQALTAVDAFAQAYLTGADPSLDLATAIVARGDDRRRQGLIDNQRGADDDHKLGNARGAEPLPLAGCQGALLPGYHLVGNRADALQELVAVSRPDRRYRRRGIFLAIQRDRCGQLGDVVGA